MIRLHRIFKQKSRMISIKDMKDLEAFFALKDNYNAKIQNIKDEYEKGNIEICIKFIKELSLQIDENYDAYIFNIPHINSDFQYLGNLCTNIENKEMALSFYQRHHYSTYQIKSPYRGECVKLLSFRTISPYSLSDIANNEITVCSPTVMNDPFDSIALMWASPENSKRIENGFRKTHEYFIESFNPYKIRCFSKNKIEDMMNILMWSHYADDHRGFCIEYTFTPDFIEQRNFEKRVFSLILDVDYSNDNDDILKDDKISTKHAFTSKAKCWDYENEVRLLYYNPDCIGNFGKIPLGNSFISAIYFGYRCSEDNIRLIKKILGKNVSYYQMKQANGKIYTLEPVAR